ncbi:MAG: hypothetical protein JSV44_00920 [Candidatus Zixiibacteriota bacterium]|nr:MAG: hypothetical protein JSV44_00920 [candidate division Zixibacteria bacterium]
MYSTKTVNCIVLSVILLCLTFSSLGASEFTTCSYCKQATTTRSLYCTHCGTWWLGRDNIIKNEIRSVLAYSSFEFKGPGLDDQGELAEDRTETRDTLAAGVSFRHYFNSRYQHPIVPISFIPYNYRNNFIEGAAVMASDNEEFDVPHSETGRNLLGVRLNGFYHLENVFIGGNLAYSRQTDDELDADDWLNQSISVGGTFGYHNPDARIGVNLGFRDTRRDSSTKDFNSQYFEVGCFGEYMLTPAFLLAGSIEYLTESGEDYYEFRIPVYMKYIILDSWWEFAPSFSFYQNEIDIEEFDYRFKISKLYRNTSISAQPQYTIRKITGISGSMRVFRIHAGGTYAFMNRSMQVSVSAHYGFGEEDINYPERDISTYSGKLDLEYFF